MKLLNKLNDALDRLFENVFFHYLPTTLTAMLVILVGVPISFAVVTKLTEPPQAEQTYEMRCTVTLTTELDGGVPIVRSCTLVEPQQ